MKRIVFYSLLLLELQTTSCKKEELAAPQTYETDIYEFQMVDMIQNPKMGLCGPIIQARLDSSKTELIFFKAVDLPAGISFSLNAYYKGRFRILPETYKCMDGRVDPFPGQLPPTIYPNFVNILEWEKK